jgi:hypothetical protein
MEGSKRFSLNSIDWKKIGIGALVAGVGALLTYLTEVIGGIDLGEWTPVVVGIWSVIANIVRKWVADHSTK